MQSQSTAKRAPAAPSYTPRVALTGKRGMYRVQSGTNPGVFYTTTAASCSCPARKPCKHMRFVRRLNVAFFVRKEVAPTATPAPTPATPRLAGPEGADAQLAAAERHLAIKRRALADTDRQADEYAVLLHQVDQAERAVAALDASAMRAA